MPELDVTDLLSDPDVAGDGFQVVRRQETVGTNGRPVLTAWLMEAEGAVYPTGPNSLVREEATSAQLNSITVVTAFPLRGVAQDEAGNTFQPDLVLWEDSYYIVSTLNSYMRYGRGFVEAECTEFTYVGPPPQPAPAALGQLDFSQPLNSGLGGGP